MAVSAVSILGRTGWRSSTVCVAVSTSADALPNAVRPKVETYRSSASAASSLSKSTESNSSISTAASCKGRISGKRGSAVNAETDLLIRSKTPSLRAITSAMPDANGAAKGISFAACLATALIKAARSSSGTLAAKASIACTVGLSTGTLLSTNARAACIVAGSGVNPAPRSNMAAALSATASGTFVFTPSAWVSAAGLTSGNSAALTNCNSASLRKISGFSCGGSGFAAAPGSGRGTTCPLCAGGGCCSFTTGGIAVCACPGRGSGAGCSVKIGGCTSAGNGRGSTAGGVVAGSGGWPDPSATGGCVVAGGSSLFTGGGCVGCGCGCAGCGAGTG